MKTRIFDVTIDTIQHFYREYLWRLFKYGWTLGKTQEPKDYYTRGGLGDGTCKKFQLSIFNDRLEPMRQCRHEYEQNIPAVYEILKRATEEARKVAAQTISEVRHAMRIDYFYEEEFIAEQSRRYAVTSIAK